jgi:hypothetical protein
MLYFISFVVLSEQRRTLHHILTIWKVNLRGIYR